MLIETLKHTPYWVYPLFAMLLLWGYRQSRDRIVKRLSLSLFPAIMIQVSLFSVMSAFGVSMVVIALWVLGLIAAIAFGCQLGTPSGTRFMPDSNAFQVPGSWLPLLLMLALFGVKYLVGYVFARHLSIAYDPFFAGSISFYYGFFGGAFLARVKMILRCRHLADDTDTCLNGMQAPEGCSGERFPCL